MVREYRSLYITDELQKAYEAKAAGRYVVLSLPLMPCAEKMPAGGKHSQTTPAPEEPPYQMDDFPYVLEHLEEIPDAYLDKLILRFEGKPWRILETERCCLREITVEDVDTLYEIYAHPSVTAYMENLYEDPDQERAYTKDYIKNHYGFYEFGMWIIEEKHTGKIIGRAGLDMIAKKENPQLGFVVRRECQRKGYAYEVCRAILSYAHEELGFDTVEATCHACNLASVNLLCKLGFSCANQTLNAGNFNKKKDKICMFRHEQKRAPGTDKCYTIV